MKLRVLIRDNGIPTPVGTQGPGHGDIGIAERRRRVRIRIHWPIELLLAGRTVAIQTTTRDLSSDGFFCWSAVQLTCGERLVAIIRAPAHTPKRPDGVLAIECQVRIAHVEPRNPDGLYGLGCEITDYRLAPA